jgi:DNA polymerase-3 subunit delta'
MQLEGHPHASAVLSAALENGPSHAYLFHGPAGTGKRAAAREFAATLLAGDDAGARIRVEHGSHPDLTWVAPSGAHEMLRRDVDEAVVSAASRTPFEADYRMFVLERADTMNDEAANSLLKTLEEPAPHVVLILLTDRHSQVLPTIASRCQPVRFDPPPAARIAETLTAVDPQTAQACARLSLGDGERARQLAFGDGPALRRRAEVFAREPTAGKPWGPILVAAKERGGVARDQLDEELKEELQYLPKKEHKSREREYNDRARRAERRAETEALDHTLQLIGLWYRDRAVTALDASELVHNVDRDVPPGDPAAMQEALELVEDTRSRLLLNVSAELAFEALAYRLEPLVTR